MKRPTQNLDNYAEKIRSEFTTKDSAREKLLPLCRELIRYSSTTIRAIHRKEFEEAKTLLKSARRLRDRIEKATSACDEMRYTGYVRDAQKEFTEANATLAIILGKPVPSPEELGVDPAA